VAKEKAVIGRNSEEVLARKQEIVEAKRAAEIVTLSGTTLHQIIHQRFRNT
jgi:hypothetical protein